MEEGGYEGRFPFRMQGKRVPHLWGWREQRQVIDRVSGWEAGLCQGAGAMGPPPPALQLWRATGIHCCSCHILALSVTSSFYHFFHPSPYTFPDTACLLLRKSSYSSTFCLGVRKSYRCTASTLCFLYISALSVLFF